MVAKIFLDIIIIYNINTLLFKTIQSTYQFFLLLMV